jgi:hypothetical protein
MQQDREHIIVTKLDRGYVESLCGQVVRPVGYLWPKPDSEYLRFNGNVDCQDCLRKHFKKKAL